MIVNIENFKTLLRKSTLNFSIDNVSLEFTPSRIKSQMTNKEKNAVAILNVENDVILELKGEMTFNFYEPNLQLLPYLNLIQAEEASLDFKENKIKLSSGSLTSTIHFCDDVLTKFGADSPKFKEYFLTIPIDENIKDMFSSIKKIATKFGIVYFTVQDNKFYMETMDKKNKLSNGLTFEVSNIEVSDRVLGFDFKNLSHLFSILDENKNFEMNFSYIESKNAGMLYIKDENTTEQYILMSKIE